MLKVLVPGSPESRIRGGSTLRVDLPEPLREWVFQPDVGSTRYTRDGKRVCVLRQWRAYEYCILLQVSLLVDVHLYEAKIHHQGLGDWVGENVAFWDTCASTRAMASRTYYSSGRFINLVWNCLTVSGRCRTDSLLADCIVLVLLESCAL